MNIRQALVILATLTFGSAMSSWAEQQTMFNFPTYPLGPWIPTNRPPVERHHHEAPQNTVYVQTIVPVTYAPVVASPLTGDYGTDLANLNGKLSRLRNVTERQYQTGQISQTEYDAFASALDGIEHDEHERSFNTFGQLSSQDLAEFFQRLEQVSGDIEIALAN